MKLNYGDSAAQKVSERIGLACATAAAMTAIPANRRVHGMLILRTDTGDIWRVDTASTATVGADALAFDAGAGRLLRSAAAGGGGYDFKDSVRAATTGNLVGTRTGAILTETGNGALGAQDGVTMVVNDRLLVKDQTTQADRGIYVITSLGSAGTPWTMARAADFDSSAKVTAGLLIPVSEGTTNGNKAFQLTTNDAITLNTTSLTFAQIGVALGVAAPLDIGVAAAGTAGVASNEDHVHAHGNALGGTLHADANATTAGFLTAAHFNLAAGLVKGLCVKGVAATNVANLAAFVIAGFDGVTYAENDLVLLANQTTGAESGVYIVGVVAGTAPLTRVNWMPTGAVLNGGFTVHSDTGTLFANTDWFISTDGAITVGTTAHLWFPRSVTISQALIAGTMTITTIPYLSTTKSNVAMTRRIANTSTNTVGGYCLTTGGANGVTPGVVGTASIVIEACVAAGTINAADVSTLQLTFTN